MRLWSLHPSLLDRAALVACWREALLAQKVLRGETRGYRQHPQLARFRAAAEPLEAIGGYLEGLRGEAEARGYRFDASRIARPHDPTRLPKIDVTSGQLAYELEWLRAKVAVRAPEWLGRLPDEDAQPHPIFTRVDGDIEPFEVVHETPPGAREERVRARRVVLWGAEAPKNR